MPIKNHYLQMSLQFFPADVLSLISPKLASAFLPFFDELQFHAMLPLLLNVSLFTLILHEQQYKKLSQL